MAADGGSLSTTTHHLEGQNKGDTEENTPQIEDMMERLRSRITHQKTWLDATKALRISNAERTTQLDVSDRSCLQKYLEKLQKALKVTALNWMIERLEALARQCSLKFSNHGSTEVHLSADMFLIQIMMEVSGRVRDVRITHSGDPTTERCPELAESLSNGNFNEFQTHLTGLISMYQVGAIDKKQKTKMCLALQSVEKDLTALSQMQKKISGVSNYVHKTPLGILLPRRAGRPMKLIYYVAPYDLLNKRRKAAHDMTIEEITENELGHSVTVAIESSTPHKLQTIPLNHHSKTQDGKILTSFSGLNHVNSTTLPATFVLHLQKPIPLSMSVLRRIQSTTGIEFVQASQARSLLSLLIQQITKGKTDPHSGSSPLYVSLPDQNHGYFVGGLNGTADLMGVTISKIPFSHPTHVPGIIQQLRQQICFNTIIGSCIRPKHKPDMHRCLTFEVTPISLQQLTINFEHPVRDSIGTVELDLTDVTNVRCKMYTSDDESSLLCTDEHISKLMHRSMSLPITMRSILKKAAPDLELQIEKLAVVPPPLVTTPISRMGLERRQAFIEAHHTGGMTSVDRQLSLQGMTGSYSVSASVSSVVIAASMDAIIQGYPDPSTPGDMNQVQHQLTPPTPREDKASKNPMLASLLDQDTNSPEAQQPSMLSQLLNNETAGGNAGQGKQKKPRKRKSTSDVRSPGSAGRSPKRKPNEDDIGAVREFTSLDMDLNSHGSNSYDISAVQGQEHQHMNLQRPQQQAAYGNSNVHESHVSRLASSVDNIIKQESNNFSGVPHQPGLEMPQPPPYTHPPMAFPNEIKQEHQAYVETQGLTIKREGSHSSQSTSSRLSKGNSLADLLKTDSPTSDADSLLAPPPITVSGSLPKKELGMLSPAVNDRSVGFGTKNHKSFDSALSNSGTKSHDFRRSNSVEILDSPPAKVKTEGVKSVNMLTTKNSISRDKTKFANDSKLDSSNLKQEDKQGSAAKDRVKKEKHEDDQVPRLTLKLNKRDLTTSKEVTPGADTPPLQDPFDHAKAITPKEPSRLSFKEKFRDKEHIYDLSSDPEEAEPLPQLGHARTTTLSSESSKLSSPSVKMRKIKSEDAAKLIRKKSASKYDGEYSRKKRKERDGSEGRRDKIKKKKIYVMGSELSSSSGDTASKSTGSSPNLMSGEPLKNKPSTTIRISNVAGKLQITPKPNNSPSLQTKSSPKTSLSSSNPKSLKSTSSASKINRPPGSAKQLNRSKSDPHGIGANRVDTKLTTKTPTIKLKPIVMPSSTTTVTVNASGSKVSQSAGGGSTPNQSGSKSTSAEKTISKSGSKPPLQKQRKGSLSAVIDNLKQRQQGPSGKSRMPTSLSQKLDNIEKRNTGRVDALSTKNKLDAIRKEIIMAAQGPPKVVAPSSQGKSNSSRLSSEAGFTRLEKSGKLDFSVSGTPPALLPSTPIPKISKTTGASPAALPSIPIPKISNSASKSATNSAASNKFSSSASVLSRSASNVSSAQSTEAGKSSAGPKESSYSSKGPSGALGGNDAGKGKMGGPSPVGGGGSNQASQEVLRKENQGPVRKPDQTVRHSENARDNHSPSFAAHNSQSLHNSSKDLTNNEDGAKKIKLDDSGDRSQGRHFLDALGAASSHGNKGENSGKGEANNKESYKAGMKRPISASSGGESSKAEQHHHSGANSVDRSRINGLNASSASLGSRNSPKEGSNRAEKNSFAKENFVKSLEHTASSNATDRSSSKSVTVNNKQVNSLDFNHRSTKPHYNQPPGGGTSNNATKGTSQTSHVSATNSNSKLTNSHGESLTGSNSDSSQTATVPTKQDRLGAFDNKENTDIASPDPEDGVFKAPTPKTSRRDEMESSEARSSRLDKIKPIRSPCSNPSSPEDSLVIDCPGTPSSKSSKSPGSRSNDRSPVTVINRPPVCPNATGPISGGEIRSKSPATGIISNKLPPPQSPSTRKPILTNKLPPPASPSPPKSPMMQHNSPVVTTRQSPVEIDDDLMDEAITM